MASEITESHGGAEINSGDQTEPGVRLKSTCLDLVVSFNLVQWTPWCFVLELCRHGFCHSRIAIFKLAPFVSLLDTEVLCLRNCRFTRHFSCSLFHSKLFFQTRLSWFSFKRNANEVILFSACRLGLWKRACSWREMSSDIVCCLSVFLDMAIFRGPPSVFIVEAKYRIFYLRQCLMFILNSCNRVKYGVLLSNTIVNCTLFCSSPLNPLNETFVPSWEKRE